MGVGIVEVDRLRHPAADIAEPPRSTGKMSWNVVDARESVDPRNAAQDAAVS
jgi:hypothetical protein